MKDQESPGWPQALVVLVGSVGLLAGSAWLVGGPSLQGYPAALWLAAGALLVQWVAYVPAILQRSERHYDLVGSLTYLGLVTAATGISWRAGSLDWRGLVAAALVSIWALRLGSFLFLRVHRAGKDGRFDEIKHSPPRFLIAWTLQGVWVFWTGLAAWILILFPGPKSVSLLDVMGISLWILGFAIEVMADRQKAGFRARPENRERWIDSGLWAWSRHPNYLGEILLWTGMLVFGAGIFQGGQWVGLLSPVFVATLLIKGSGIPLLEARAEARWGGDPAYQDYKKRTPVLVPGSGSCFD